jgi:predicted O-methyltransferase YrrM
MHRAVHRVRRLLRDRLRIDIRRTPLPPRMTLPTAVSRPTKQTTSFEVDAAFYERLAQGHARSGMPVEEVGRLYAERAWLLEQLVDLTEGVDGLVAECGVYRGLSSYLLCRRLREQSASFSGKEFHAFDSFEGLSAPGAEDHLDATVEAFGAERQEGRFRAGVETVRSTLADFPDATLHRGWVPEVLTEAPIGPYRLVHLDLDLHDPTLAGLEFFHPRLAPGGVIVVDDYGSLRWPGVMRAVAKFCASNDASVLPVPAGQAIVFATRD